MLKVIHVSHATTDLLVGEVYSPILQPWVSTGQSLGPPAESPRFQGVSPSRWRPPGAGLHAAGLLAQAIPPIGRRSLSC